MTKKEKDKRRDIKIYLLVFIFFGIITFFYLWHHINVIRAGYRIEELKKEKLNLQKEIRKLTIRKNELERLERVDEIAKDKLKLIKVKDSDIVIVKEKR
jgi:cell division protein FtsL